MFLRLMLALVSKIYTQDQSELRSQLTGAASSALRLVCPAQTEHIYTLAVTPLSLVLYCFGIL